MVAGGLFWVGPDTPLSPLCTVSFVIRAPPRPRGAVVSVWAEGVSLHRGVAEARRGGEEVTAVVGKEKRDLWDVVAVVVPSFTRTEILVTVVSGEHHGITVRVRASAAVQCISSCGHGTCDFASGACLCEEGFFGPRCDATHAQWMRRRVPLQPLLLIPGLGGSQLIGEKGSSTGETEALWASVGPVGMLSKAKFDPASGKVAQDDPEWTVRAPRGGYGLEGIETLLPKAGLLGSLEAMMPAAAVQRAEYLAPLVRELEGAGGYTPGVDLFGFPYDWRQSSRSVELVDDLRDTIASIARQSGRKVQVVSHSMGGLLFQSYLAAHPEAAARDVSMWTAVACPFRGATGAAFKAFFEGDVMGDPLLSRADARSLAALMPSAYELLPDPAFAWDPEPTLSFSLEGEARLIPQASAAGSQRSVAKLIDAAVKCGSAGQQASSMAPALFEYARSSRQIRSFAALPGSVAFFNIHGTTALRSTPNSLTYMTPFDSVCDIIGARPDAELVAGDGVVPLQSAASDGFPWAAERILLPEVAGHVAIIKDERVLKLIRSLTGTECSFEGVWRAPAGAEFSLFQFGQRVYGHLAKNFKFAGSARHGRLEGIVLTEGAPSSSFLTAEMEPECLKTRATYRNSTTLVTLASLELERVVGSQCSPGETTACRVRRGSGLRGCSFGFWSTQCLVSSCHPGHHMRVDKLLNQVLCAPDDDNGSAGGPHVAEHRCSDPKHPFLCVDSSCASGIEECLRRGRYSDDNQGSRCPVETPILCEDGSCVRLLPHCEDRIKTFDDDEAARKNRLPGFACPPGKSVVCPSGACAATRDLCAPAHNERSSYPCPGKLVLCPSSRTCVTTLALCDPFKRTSPSVDDDDVDAVDLAPRRDPSCPWGAPVICPRARGRVCVTEASQCEAAIEAEVRATTTTTTTSSSSPSPSNLHSAKPTASAVHRPKGEHPFSWVLKIGTLSTPVLLGIGTAILFAATLAVALARYVRRQRISSSQVLGFADDDFDDGIPKQSARPDLYRGRGRRDQVAADEQISLLMHARSRKMLFD